MLVKTLEAAEEIVARYSYLEWDGWTIVRYKPDPAGFYAKNGVYRNGRWFQQFRYEPQRMGWELPSFLGKP